MYVCSEKIYPVPQYLSRACGVDIPTVARAWLLWQCSPFDPDDIYEIAPYSFDAAPFALVSKGNSSL
jgi:hypothetical protein